MIYVAAASYIFQNEAKFFYKHKELAHDYQYALSKDYQELNIPINDDINLHALWIKQHDAKGLVLYFAGGDYLSGELSKSQEFYFHLGYQLLIPEYRGNGKSTGKYETEDDIFSDANQWMKMAGSIADSLPVVLVGREFGSGIAAEAYQDNQSELLIMEEPYRAWNDVMLRKYFWWLPHTYFTHFEIPTWKYIRASTHPVVIIHPTEAKNIKLKNSELLLEYFKPGDVLITVNGKNIDYQSKEFLNKFEQVKLP